MKKVFSILLTLAMLLNVGIVAMAEEETVFSLDFETTMDITKSGKNNSITYDDVTLTNNKNSSNYYSNIIEYSAGTGVDGSQSLKLQAPAYGYANVSYNVSNLEVGRIYRFSANVKLDATATNAKATNMSTITDGVYYVNRDANGNVDSLVKRCGTAVTAATGGVTGFTLNSDSYTTITKEFYVSEDAPATVKFTLSGLGSSANKTVYYYVDDVSLVKTDDYVGIQCEEDAIVKPAEGNTAEVTYSLTGTGVATAEEIVKIGEYEGVDVANGKVTVTSAAQSGTLTIGIKKNLYTAADTYTETVIMKKEIQIKECEAVKGNNILGGGCFEDENDLADAIAEQVHSTAVTHDFNTEEAKSYCGSGSLHVTTTGGYRAFTFKKTLEKGKVYKFTAYALAAADSPSKGVNLSVQRNVGDEGQHNGIYTFNASGTKLDAGYVYRASDAVTLDTANWTKYERYIYVSDDIGAANTTDAYIGLKGTAWDKGVEYYIDDVSLVEIGKFTGANGIDIPAGNTTATYTFTKAAGVADDFPISLKETDNPGATFADNTLTVENTAVAGLVNVQVKLGEQVIADKQVALFDATGMIVSRTTPSGDKNTANVTFTAHFSSTVFGNKPPVLFRANYGTDNTYNSVETTKARDLNECWLIKTTDALKTGELNKYMLLKGFDNMQPLQNVDPVTYVKSAS